jgi:hypothetical protein
MKRLALAAIFAFASVMTLGTAASAEAQGQGTNNNGLAIPIVGSSDAGEFAGTFTLQRFAVTDGAVTAVGRLVGTVTNTATGAVTSIVRNVALPVAVGEATCDILHLDLGPLNLDLLGLQIDLSQIVLDITAESGPGNLLGNLLCAVAGLLDNPNGLAKLLNQILSVLG